MMSHEQGSDTVAITGQKQAPNRAIPNGKGELAIEFFHALGPPLLIGMDDDFRITASTKYVAQIFQLASQFNIIENLSIEGEHENR